MSTLPVKWYHSMMRGIPVVAGQVGKMIALLDACLVNGFGQVSSTTSSVSNKVLTIILSNSETFEKHSVVAISGDDQLKGEYRVIETTNSYIKVKVDLPDQTFNGTIYIKYAPLGWSKITPATPANTALYIPKESYSGFNLYVNDNYTTAAHVQMCTGAKNNNTLTNETSLIDPVPILPSNLTKNYPMWPKSYTASNDTRANFLIGDGSLFYYQWGATHTVNSFMAIATGKMMTVGDIKRYSEEDDLAAVFTCKYYPNLNAISSFSDDDSMAAIKTDFESGSNSFSARYRTFLGDLRGNKGNDFAGRIPLGYTRDVWSGARGFILEESLGMGLELNKLLAVNSRTVRGEYPGIYHIPFIMHTVEDLSIENGSGDLINKQILFKVSAIDTPSYDNGGGAVVAFDITGPWR